MVLFKYGVEIFEGSQKQYGGHWQKLSDVTGLDYLSIYFCWGFGLWETYYDGYHSRLTLGVIGIAWGGKPINRDDFH